MQKKLFRLLSKLMLALYRRFPIFGTLRASVAIIRDGELVFAIHRNDGRGYSPSRRPSAV
jgi:hypothetical protein